MAEVKGVKASGRPAGGYISNHVKATVGPKETKNQFMQPQAFSRRMGTGIRKPGYRPASTAKTISDPMTLQSRTIL